MTEQKIRRMMAVLLLLQLLAALYWGFQKEGYYIDELWSYGLANSRETPFLQDKAGYMNAWHGPEFYGEYLTVDPGEWFDFRSVYENQAQDVHPPFYYLLLHTVCSVFAGEFSKWFGLAINLCFFAGILWLLFAIGGKLLGRENPARLLPPLLYGFSGGALSMVVYIRMYAMLTFWVLLFTLLVFASMEARGKSGRRQIGVFVGILALPSPRDF